MNGYFHGDESALLVLPGPDTSGGGVLSSYFSNIEERRGVRLSSPRSLVNTRLTGNLVPLIHLTMNIGDRAPSALTETGGVCLWTVTESGLVLRLMDFSLA